MGELLSQSAIFITNDLMQESGGRQLCRWSVYDLFFTVV